MKQIQQNQNQIILYTNEVKKKILTTAAVNFTIFIKEWKDFWYILNDFSILSQETKQIKKDSINFSWKLEF